MSLSKEDLNQIKLIVKDLLQEEIAPLKLDLANLREEFKVTTSNLRNDFENFKQRTEAQFQIHYQMLVDIKSEISGIYRYINTDFRMAEKPTNTYGTKKSKIKNLKKLT